MAAAWLAGVLLGLSSGVGTEAALLMAGGAAVAAIGLRLARMPVAPALLAAVLLLGLARAEASQTGPANETLLAGQEITAVGSIVNDPEQSAAWARFELQVSQVLLEGETREADERWLVYAAPSEELARMRDAPFFRYGDTVTLEGTPQAPHPFDGFDYPAYLAAQGITATMFARGAQVTGEGGAQWRSALYAVRRQLADSIERAMPFPESAVGSAMLLGKRESLPQELVEEFRGSGAAHLLAISGLHVGVLMAATTGAMAWLLGRRRPTYLLVSAAVIWLYALTAGAPPSALRAAAMGTAYLVALGLGRPSAALPALALAAALMTLASPNLAQQISFQLSFAAVAGIALALSLLGGQLPWSTGPSSAWWRRLTGWAVALIIISLAASLATWPLAAANFGQVALLGVPVSVLTVPAMAPLIVSTLAASVAGLAFSPLGTMMGWLAAAPAAWVVGVVTAAPSWTWDAEGVGRPLLLAWYGGLGLALLLAQRFRLRRWLQAITRLSQRISPQHIRARMQAGGGRLALPNPYLTITAAVALGIAAAILWARATEGTDGLLHVYFLDIGQGDSVLVVTPSGRQALIDGGPDGDRTSQALADTLPGGERSLDLVVMTHLDADHSSGLLDVFDRYTVGAALSGPLPTDNPMRALWEQSLQKHNITPVEVSAGYAIQLDDGVELRVLNPSLQRPFGESNNDSIALRLVYGEMSFILTADMEGEAEERLVNSGAQLRSTVLKAGHHGSATSTTQRFLDAVSPAMAVISSGAGNPYGHPAPSVVERLESAVGAANVYRTDTQGDVEVITDGASLWVRTER